MTILLKKDLFIAILVVTRKSLSTKCGCHFHKLHYNLLPPKQNAQNPANLRYQTLLIFCSDTMPIAHGAENAICRYDDELLVVEEPAAEAGG